MKYESTEQKILKILYPPVLYMFICICTQFVVSTILIGMDIKQIEVVGANVSQSASFVENIDAIISENSVLMNCISALIALAIFVVIYIKDSKENNEMSITKYIRSIKCIDFLNSYSIGLTLATGISLLVSILPIDNLLGSYENTSELLLNGDFFQLFVVLGILVPFTEEVIYRGLIYNRIRRYMNVNKAIVISALLFGVFHLNLMQGIYAFLIGIIMGYLYYRYDNIFAPIALHMAVNQLTVVFKCTGVSDYLEKNDVMYILFMLVALILGGFLMYKTVKTSKS